MPLNTLVANLALENLNKFKPDSSLYDAIVEMDMASIKYLCNKKYREEIINRGYVKEPINISKLIEIIENSLYLKSKVKVAC